MQCYACDHDATRQCRRCSRLYCEEHGADVCNECLAPASGLPSVFVYRGSLLALLVAAAVGIWLLVRPPGEGDSDNAALLAVSPTPERVTTVRPASSRTPDADQTGTPEAETTATAETSPTARPEPTATPAPREYVVQEGDSLISIAEANAPPGADLIAYAREIAELNGIDFDSPIINPGDVLKLPD